MSKQIYLKDSQKKMLEGINLLADSVQSTLGPSGKTVIIQNEGQEPFTTKDGVTVAESINHENPIMNVGIQMVRKVASKMDEDSHDGTTSVTVICRKLIESGMESRNKEDFSSHEYKKEIEQALEKTIEIVRNNSVAVDISDVRKIAFTSANNDEVIGDLFQEAFNNSGKEGYINIVESVTGKSYVKIIDGFVVDLGYSERKYANNPITGFFEASKAYVMIIDNELNDKKEISKIIKYFNNKATKLPILIFAKDFSKDVNNIVDFNNMDRSGDNICLVKNYLRNDEYVSLLSDIGNYTGATPFKDFSEWDQNEGLAYNLIVKEGYTVFGEAQGSEKSNLDNYIVLLQAAAESEQSPAYSDSIKKRISKMTKGITTLYVGGDSDIEIKEKKHRVDDAYGACKAALISNVIIGGGQSLLLIAEEQENEGISEYQQDFYNAIQEPFKQILRNSNHSEREIETIKRRVCWEDGYNAKTRKFEDLQESGVVDPVLVVVNSLKNAVSIAMTILSTECLIVEVPQK